MNRRKRFETMKNLLEIKERPFGIQFRPKQQQRGIGADGDESPMLSPYFDVSKQNRCRTSLMAVPKKFRRSKRRMAMMHDLYGQVEATSSIMERAQAVQANLDARFPSFVKPMIRSIVTKGFWLSLPKLFCELHLPEHDATVILEDENQTEHNTKYLAERRGLSGGWRGFSIAHNLVEGDVLVFHMVKFCKMKVYIIRSNHLAEVDAALCLMHLDTHRTEKKTGQKRDDARVLEPAGEKLQRSALEGASHGNYENCMGNSNIRLVMNQPESGCEDLQLALEGLISKTYSIASAIRASKTKALPNDCAIWNKRLIGHEQLQHNLGQVQDEIDQLVGLVLELNEGGYTSNLKIKIFELKEAIGRLHSEIEVLRMTTEMPKLTL